MVYPVADNPMVFLHTSNLPGAVFVLAGLFMVVRRGRDGLVMLFLALFTVGCAGWIASGLLLSAHPVHSTALAGLVYIFFSRGDSGEKLYTALIVLYAFLVAWSGIYKGVYSPGDAAAGMFAGIACSGLAYTLFAWVVKNIVHLNILKHSARG